MDEATGNPRAGDGETKQQNQQLSSCSSPIHETRLAALRRKDVVLQGGFTATLGRTPPTLLLLRSNSIRAGSSPAGCSARGDLQSSWPQSPRSQSPRASASEELRFSSSTTGLQFSSRSATFSRKGSRWVLVGKRGAAVFCFVAIILFLWFALEWWHLSGFQEQHVSVPARDMKSSQADRVARDDSRRVESAAVLHERLLALAAHGLAENELKPEPGELWEPEASPNGAAARLPCANPRRTPEPHMIPPPLPEDSTGYIMINAKGDLAQQRDAICNGVAVAGMLNATLVLPRLIFPSDSKHSRQFKDLYMEDYFINYLKEDVPIVKELPIELQSRLDLDAIEVVVTEDDIPKEANPSFYLKHILPILSKTHIVLFEGFSNCLDFNSIPQDIKTMRCRCNFHALKFTPELQRTGNLIAERMRDRHPRWGPGDDDDEFQVDVKSPRARVQPAVAKKNEPKYLAVHVQHQETDVTAACSSSSGLPSGTQRDELRAYVDEHLNHLLENLDPDAKLGLSSLKGELGVCTPTLEESILILAALGFKRATRIYLAAGADVMQKYHGFRARMARLKILFPNLVTKEDLLSVQELQLFHNHSTQLEVLDYMSCTLANVFVMTDSSSQLASMMSRDQAYNGSRHATTMFPNNMRLTTLFQDNNATIEWKNFEEKVRKAFIEIEHVYVPHTDMNVYERL